MTHTRRTDPLGTPGRTGAARSTLPLLYQSGAERARFGEIRLFSIALAHHARGESRRLLNRILADSTILYNLYKKHHRVVGGTVFHELRLLFDRHAEEQLKVIDLVGERVHRIGGVAIADPRHVAELTTVPRPPGGDEKVPEMLARLLEAHEIVLGKVREAIEKAAAGHDDGTADLLMGEVLRTNELQVWFVAEHLVNLSAAEV
ncbi:Dps family protein [Actinomadura sp. HBU206391]|uniref:Dps family protein n=1 Tax=Actinomadura sp. HBU206391 TaxID=2731692 RepID=UPI00164F4172|nr:DNA starvation/stationary phase protection protein [Actinomadura sp. HBU206391]MBC6458212.1 DNA starvation/stationary phase protection protein [Actinomadura sp. HBU206391]